MAPYNNSWAELFSTEGEKLRQILGESAIRIDHIGSTSVPGLAAKDIIDIQITLESLDNAEEFCEKMKSAGYQQRGGIRNDCLIGESDDNKLRKLYFREAYGDRRTHIHVRQQGLLNQEFPLLFRDYLRANESVRMAYELIKQRLANIYPESINGYLYIKDPVMDIIYQGAKEWAKNTHWQPDNSYL